MAEEQTKELTHFHWKTPEFKIYRRGKIWYFVAGFITVILFMYAILSTNYLFAIIILIFAIIITVSSMRSPEIVDVKISDTGVMVGNKFTPYYDIDHFYVVHDPEVKNLYLEFGGGLRNRVILPLDDQDPAQIRECLCQYLPEDLDRIDEPFIEFMARILKL